MLSESVESCAQQIREAILKGTFEEGERLPTERALAEDTGVSRPTARTALISLTAERLVYAKQGSGYRVAPFLDRAGPLLLCAWLPLLSRKKRRAVVRDILRLRRYLALALFERLREVQSEGELELGPVQAQIAMMEQALSPDAQKVAKLDLAILAALLEASQSVTLRLCFNPVSQIVLASKRLCRAMYAAPEHNALRWRLVLQMLEQDNVNAPELLAMLEENDRQIMENLGEGS